MINNFPFIEHMITFFTSLKTTVENIKYPNVDGRVLWAHMYLYLALTITVLSTLFYLLLNLFFWTLLKQILYHFTSNSVI